MLKRTALLVLAAAVLTPVAQSPSVASIPPPRTAEIGSWGPISLLDRGEMVLNEDAVAIDGGGEITATWGEANLQRAYTSHRSLSGEWVPRTLLARGRAPAIETDSRGVVTAVWVAPRGVVAARRVPGQAWSAPVVLDRAGWVPDLVVGPADRVVAVWAHGATIGTTRIRAAFHPPRGRWTTSVDVTPAIGAIDPEVGVNQRGVVTLLYAVSGTSVNKPRALQTRRWLPGRGWTGPIALADRSVSAELATSPAGDAAVVFLSRRFGRLRAVVRMAGGAWGRARLLSPADVDYLGTYSVAFDLDRSVLVVWTRDTGRVDLVRRPVGGPWSAPSQVGRGAWLAEVVTGPSGDAFVAWAQDGLFGRYRPAGGAWSDPQTISPRSGWPVEDLSVAMGPAGDVVALWSREETFRLRARVFTAAP